MVRGDSDAGAAVPNLWCLLAVPPEGEDVLAWAEVGRHLHLVHDGEEELRQPRGQVGLTEAQETWEGGRKLWTSPETVRLHLREITTVWQTTGRDGVLGPLRSLRPGALGGPVSRELQPGPRLPVLHPLSLPVELEWRLLEAFLCDQPGPGLGLLAETVGVTSSVVGYDAPAYCDDRPCRPLRDDNIFKAHPLG